MNNISDTLEYILKAIVEKPEEISVTSEEVEDVTVFEISAPSEMVGKIIGKEGKVIKSIRTILNLSYPNIKFALKIKE
ncbi:MAG: KH domain-containing protein [Candidatus Shapirobacteria bacterium]